MTAIYNYGLDLLNHIEIRKGNMLPLEFAEHAEEKAAEYLEKGRFTSFIQTALKAGYSSEQISPEEIRECENTVNTLAKNIYKSKNRRDRFIFRYILNMCK